MSDARYIPRTGSAKRYYLVAALIAVALLVGLLLLGKFGDADTVNDDSTCTSLDAAGRNASSDAEKARIWGQYTARGCHASLDTTSGELGLGLVEEGEPCGPDGIALPARVGYEGFVMLCWDAGDGVNRWHVDPRQFYVPA